MTWSHDPATGVYNQATWNDRWQAIYDDLNGVGDPATPEGGWQVWPASEFGVSGTSGADDRVIVFTFIDTNYNEERQWCYYFDYSYSSYTIQGCPRKDPTNTTWPLQWMVSSRSARHGAYTSVTNDWIKWTSDQDPTAWMITIAGRRIGGWDALTNRTCPWFTNNLTSSGYIQYGCLMPQNSTSSYANCMYYNYPWYASNTTSTSDCYYALDVTGTFAYSDATTFINMALTGGSLGSFGITTNDMLFYYPSGSQSGTNLISSTAATVTASGNNFYINMGSTISNPTLLLDCGSENPSNALLG